MCHRKAQQRGPASTRHPDKSLSSASRHPRIEKSHREIRSLKPQHQHTRTLRQVREGDSTGNFCYLLHEGDSTGNFRYLVREGESTRNFGPDRT